MEREFSRGSVQLLRFILNLTLNAVILIGTTLSIKSVGSETRYNSDFGFLSTTGTNASQDGFFPSNYFYNSLQNQLGFRSPAAQSWPPVRGFIPQALHHTHPQLRNGHVPRAPISSFQSPYGLQERLYPYPSVVPTSNYLPSHPASIPYPNYVIPSVPNGAFSPYKPPLIPPPFQYPHYGSYYPIPSKPKLHDGFDIGSLPKQVRVPGVIRVDIIGKDAEITCEFPKYLILIQGIYWHHKYNDPFGSYFDTQNRFGGHTTVRAVTKWKSTLTIQDFNINDVGTYRCISAAALPANAESLSQSLKTGSYNRNAKFNPNPTLSTAESPPPVYLFGSTESVSPLGIPSGATSQSSDDKKTRISRDEKNSRKIRFPPSEEAKVRVVRQLSMERTTGIQDTPARTQLLESTSDIRRHYSIPYVPNYNNQDYTYKRLTNPYARGPQGQTDEQSDRHLSYFHSGFTGLGWGIHSPVSHLYPPHPASTGFGLKLPYYHPNLSYVTVYQEIKFDPSGLAGRRKSHGGHYI